MQTSHSSLIPISVRAHRLVVPFFMTLSSVIVLVFFPDYVYFFASGYDTIGRPILTQEFSCYLLAWAMTIMVSPRFYLWHTIGKFELSVYKILESLLVIIFPALVFYISVPKCATESVECATSGENPLVIITNVIVFSSLALLFIGLLGVMLGSISLLVVSIGILYLQANGLIIMFLPFIWTFLPSSMQSGSGFDATIKWFWVLVLPLLAVFISGKRRMVPLMRVGTL